jgi:hypothetical protein
MGCARPAYTPDHRIAQRTAVVVRVKARETPNKSTTRFIYLYTFYRKKKRDKRCRDARHYYNNNIMCTFRSSVVYHDKYVIVIYFGIRCGALSPSGLRAVKVYFFSFFDAVPPAPHTVQRHEFQRIQTGTVIHSFIFGKPAINERGLLLLKRAGTRTTRVQ